MFPISARVESVAPERNFAGARSRNIDLPLLTRRDCAFSTLWGFIDSRNDVSNPIREIIPFITSNEGLEV